MPRTLKQSFVFVALQGDRLRRWTAKLAATRCFVAGSWEPRFFRHSRRSRLSPLIASFIGDGAVTPVCRRLRRPLPLLHVARRKLAAVVEGLQVRGMRQRRSTRNILLLAVACTPFPIWKLPFCHTLGYF
nr:hypothetical protein Itr_chr05CG14690 [Ipomoea trifida]